MWGVMMTMGSRTGRLANGTPRSLPGVGTPSFGGGGETQPRHTARVGSGAPIGEPAPPALQIVCAITKLSSICIDYILKS